jgi:hypothetical protein
MNATATACPRCNGALAPGAQFCGACGSAVGAAPPPQAPAYTPPMPQTPAIARGFGGGGGNFRQLTIAAGPAEAFNAAMRVIDGAGAETHWRQPPQGAKFVLTRKSVWTTLGMAIKYDGDLQLAPAGAGQSSARLSLKVRWASAAGLLLTQVAMVVIASMFNLYIAYYSLIIIGLSLGITAWTVSSRLPEQALKELGDQIVAQADPSASALGRAPAAPMQQPPAYGAAPVAPPQAAPAPSANTEAIMEQIRQLGALRDAGVLTPPEFEAKKAELLARL